MENRTDREVVVNLRQLNLRKNCELMALKAGHLANHTTPAMTGPHTPGRDKEIRELCIETIGIATEIVEAANNTVIIIDAVKDSLLELEKLEALNLK